MVEEDKKLPSSFVVLADKIVDFSIEVKVLLTIVWFAEEDLQKNENFMSTSTPQPKKIKQKNPTPQPLQTNQIYHPSSQTQKTKRTIKAKTKSPLV